MKPSVLITGGAGYIGSHVVELLQSRGVGCAVIDDLSTGHGEAVQTPHFYRGQIQDEELVRRIFREHPGIESTVHLAGSIIVPESVADPIKYYRNNIFSAIQFVETAMECGLKNIIFSSTASVYGDHPEGPCRESDPPDPSNPYGRTKLVFEWFLRDLAFIGKINYVALRYFNVGGASSSGQIGQRTKNATHLLKVAAEAACGKRDHMSIFGDDYSTPDGTCIRDFIHVEDLALAHLKALEYLQGRGESRVFNCGYGRGYSVREIIAAFKRETGVDFPVSVTERRDGDVPRVVAQTDSIREELGWVPEKDDLSLLIRSAYEFEKNLP